MSVPREHLAEHLSLNHEFDDIDAVWASSYVRTMSTAKYFDYRNNLKVNVDEGLNERIYGIKSWDELPTDFEEHQFLDEDYKLNNGESRKEVTERLYTAFKEILGSNRNKTIVIVGHSTAAAFLLSKWCDVYYNKPYKFNNKVFFDGKWDYCETFKLEFDDNDNPNNVENISEKVKVF